MLPAMYVHTYIRECSLQSAALGAEQEEEEGGGAGGGAVPPADPAACLQASH